MNHFLHLLQVPLDQEFTVVASGNGRGILEVHERYTCTTVCIELDPEINL